MEIVSFQGNASWESNMSSIQRVRRFVLAVVCISATACLLAAPAAARAGDKYVAIAYSFKTETFGVGSNVDSREKAEKAALAGCKGDDAKAFVWTKNTSCCLAIGANQKCGWSGQNDGTYVDAAKIAIAECRLAAPFTVKARGFLILASSDSDVYVTEIAPPAGQEPVPSVASEIIRLTNVERRKANVPELWPNAKLTAGALKYATLMAQKDMLSHNLDGTLGNRFTAYGYNWADIAENCCAGQADAAAAVNAWMNDKPHKDNLLSPNRTEIGVGVARAPTAHPTTAKTLANNSNNLAVAQLRVTLS